MTEFLCNSLGYSKQAYYKSLRSSNEGEERERYVLSIVEEIRRDMPRLGVLKLWKMLNDNGLEVGRDWLFRLLHRHNLMVKMKKYRHYHGFSCLAEAVPEPGERLQDRTSQSSVGERYHLPFHG